MQQFIRYMDDLILLHEDKEYLKFSLKEIKNQLEKLKLNHKTQPIEIHQGINF